jgi:hypothetical protein
LQNYNILSDEINSGNNEFDILFLVDATGSMASYITAAKEETKNISDELMKLYPTKMFQYGYIFYRDPIDSHGDEHEIIDLTDNVNSFPERIGKITAYGGGDIPEDWVGAFKLANEKISWRNGIKVIIHLADAGAHGQLFTPFDKYPEEEAKLITELEKCAEKGIKIFGYVIDFKAQNSFNECSKIYRKKGGSYEIFQFQGIPMESMGMPNLKISYPNSGMVCDLGYGSMNPGIMPNNFGTMMMNNMSSNPNPMMQMMAAPSMMNNMNQMNVNMNFQRNAIQSIQSIMDKH